MNCTLACASFLLKENPHVLMDEIGHSGEDIWWPEYKDIRKFRGFALPEIQNCFIKRKLILSPIFASPVVAPDYDAEHKQLWAQDYCLNRMYMLMHNRTALVMGQLENGILHAVAKRDEIYYDPRCKIFKNALPDDYSVQEIYLVSRLD